MTAVSSSRTTLISAWPGVSDLSTSWPTARTLIFSISACTTGSATSASSSAMRTSRVASRMFSSVRRPRPRRRSMVPERRWVRDSNMRCNLRERWQRGQIIAAAGARRRLGATRIASDGRVCETVAMTIVLIAVALYLLSTGLLVHGLAAERAAGGRRWLWPAAGAFVLRGVYHLIVAMLTSGGRDMPFFAALSLVGLGMALLTTLVGARGRMAALGVLVFPMAALLLLAYHGYGHEPSRALGWQLATHAWLALLAYATLSIAALL